jgi:transketolase
VVCLEERSELAALANRVRILTMEMAGRAESGHISPALSMADMLAVLYGKVLNVDPKSPDWPERDRFILGKGHACKGVYAVLAERGFFPVERLEEYGRDGTHIAGHITRGSLPGIEASTGSLGHGLPIAVGMALAAKRDRKSYRVFALLGDGECDEGSIWEAVLCAAHFKLDNLTVLVDHNKIQGMDFVKNACALEPLAPKWSAFGWSTKEVDGHDVGALADILAEIPFEEGHPSCVVAHTTKGKGVSFLENTVAGHYQHVVGEQLERALAELRRAS